MTYALLLEKVTQPFLFFSIFLWRAYARVKVTDDVRAAAAGGGGGGGDGARV